MYMGDMYYYMIFIRNAVIRKNTLFLHHILKL